MKQLGDRAAQGRACGNLGNTHYLLGSFVEATAFHKEVSRWTGRWQGGPGAGWDPGSRGPPLLPLGVVLGLPLQAQEHEAGHAGRGGQRLPSVPRSGCS